jgi:predicted Zn-dependent peptidase
VNFKHSLDTLDNGLTVLRIPMPAVQSVTVLVLANTGSRYEIPRQYGIAHFFEHMVFKGSAGYPTAQVLAATVDGIGADFNAFTSKEYTGYYVTAASRHVDLALDVVSDMLLTPKLRQDDIDREKGVIIEEIHMYEDSPSRHIGDLFDMMAFKGSGLEHKIIGTEKTVSGLNNEDFKDFLKQWYGLENLVLVLAGDEKVVGNNAILKKATEAFSKEDPDTTGRVDHKVNVAELFDKKVFGKDQLHVEHKKTEQAHFILAWPGIHRTDPRRFALTVFSTILGGNMSSRLFTEVREQRGLAYYVHSDVDLYHDSGLFGASAGVDPKRVEEAMKVTFNEFYDVAAGEKPVTDGELQRAKEYLAGKMALNYEDSQSVAQYYGMKQLLLDKIETLPEVLSGLRAVTLDEVTQVAKDLIKPGAARLAVIGPYKNEDVFQQVLDSSK